MPRRDTSWHRGLAVVLLVSLPSLLSAQTDEEQARRELSDLQKDIQAIQQDISSATTRRDTLQKQLKDAEIELGRLQKAMAQNREHIVSSQAELKTLETRKAELEQARGRQQARIAAELKTAWQMGRQGQVKVLLNQESPHTVARNMVYYRYFFEARNELLEQARKTLQALQAVETNISKTLATLQEQQDELELQQQRIAKARENRTLAIAKLNDSIRDKGQQLKRKEQDRRELEKLLQAIEEAVVDIQVPKNFQAFKSARGKMPWPVKGKPSNRFGKSRNEGKMRWQGVNIPANEGTTVRAIHHGRVVYSDWLRGSGLLLIIDHGDGYMSLYAHNQSLLRDVGEWVSAGTPISTVGDSGGLDRAALYFEVRHQGKPTDPAKWCRG